MLHTHKRARRAHEDKYIRTHEMQHLLRNGHATHTCEAVADSGRNISAHRERGGCSGEYSKISKREFETNAKQDIEVPMQEISK